MRTYRGTITVCVDAINKASDMFGSEAALAGELGVSKQILNYWKQNTTIPFDKAFKMCVVTNGKVALDELCPTFSKTIKQYHMLFLKKHEK